ncbi:MAG: acetate/propionate family kinase [Brevinematales bacterium]|jgi:acetate kinase
MNILVFNCGSSSVSYKVFRVEDFNEIEVLITGKAHRVGVTGSEPSFIEHEYKELIQKDELPITSYEQAARLILKFIKENNVIIDLIGNRFVHGGTYFRGSAFVNPDSLKKLELCLPLAPLHNPIALSVIFESGKFFKDVRQYVVFDSAFHSTIPDYAYTYALPKRIVEKYNYRKYGFHGISYSYVIRAASDFLKEPLGKLNIVACHLGTGGSSVAAVKNGFSVDTSMGYSPLSGLVMSTRSGDIDPMIMIYMMVFYGFRNDDLLNLLNKKSGLLGVSGFSSDIRDIIGRISSEKNAGLAFRMYIQHLKKYIGSFIVAALGGIDVLIFTDDIGIKNPFVREKVCENMEWCGIVLDKDKNKKYGMKKPELLDSRNSKVRIIAVPTDEEIVIAWEGLKLLKEEKNAAL